ncbi:g2773 [Coccomyxa viridis]|uniref:G2773 protein n=1 Tax=Coccomyxa viridis TaxID=1274662 RepID=A0ABP1FRM6_9CHLO
MSSRIDAWEVNKHTEYKPVKCGYADGFLEKYELGEELGRGGFGVVRVVTHRQNGKQYAAKSIKKLLQVPNLPIQRQAAHLANVKREVSVLYRLRGTLNVVNFIEALEDDEDVHIIMELCTGGELAHSLAKRHYSERTVASYMRAVLRTLAQCHSHRILHRDIKPSNFMLLNNSDRSPLKAIDFGLAVFFEPGQLPRTDLGLEGTPWFLAPENLDSEFYPASDLWSAGVMAFQLLSGFMPFDDRRNRRNPTLSQIWKSILTEEPDFASSAWKDVSGDAKNFVGLLLAKDPKLRPTAKEALNHKWLSGGTSAERAKGKPLQETVVQRIQRFNQANLLKRTIFELIAEELLQTLMPESRDPSSHGSMPVGGATIGDPQKQGSHKRPFEAGDKRDDTPALRGPGGGAIEGPPLLGRISAGSAHGGLEYYRSRGESVHGGASALLHDQRGGSVHGGRTYWRILRAAATAAKWHSRSVHGTSDYMRWVGRSQEERSEQRKAARLCLDTSAHAGTEFQRLMTVLSNANLQSMDVDQKDASLPETASSALMDACQSPSRRAGSHSPRPQSGLSLAALPAIPETTEGAMQRALSSGEEGRRGQRAYASFMHSSGDSLDLNKLSDEKGAQLASYPVDVPRTAMQEALHAGALEQSQDQQHGVCVPRLQQAAHLEEARDKTAGLSLSSGDSPSNGSLGPRRVSFNVGSKEADGPNSGCSMVLADSQSRAISLSELREVMRKMKFTREAEAVTEAELSQGLASLGYTLDPSETSALVRPMDAKGVISKSAFVASQLDWPKIQADFREQWLAAAQKVFKSLDSQSNGLTMERLMCVLREKLPAAEIEYAVEDALVDAGYKDEEEIDFEGFIKIMRAGSVDSLDHLDQYDARLSTISSPSGKSLSDLIDQ